MKRSIELELRGKWGDLVLAPVTKVLHMVCLVDECMNNEVEGVMPVCHLRGAFLGSLLDLPRRGEEEACEERRSSTEIILMFISYLKCGNSLEIEETYLKKTYFPTC